MKWRNGGLFRFPVFFGTDNNVENDIVLKPDIKSKIDNFYFQPCI